MSAGLIIMIAVVMAITVPRTRLRSSVPNARRRARSLALAACRIGSADTAR
jgi:hypothetical protein